MVNKYEETKALNIAFEPEKMKERSQEKEGRIVERRKKVIRL